MSNMTSVSISYYMKWAYGEEMNDVEDTNPMSNEGLLPMVAGNQFHSKYRLAN
jgi:hypothetical protein